MDCVIALDLGTTGCKSIVFDAEGTILGSAYIECPLEVRSDTIIEQNAEDWWALSKRAICEALQYPTVDKTRVRAIGISSQGISFVPVDEDCKPLCSAISWLDTRAGDEVEEISRVFGEGTLSRITGKRFGSAYVLPKLLWLKKNLPNVYAHTHKFLMAQDFILAKLTGEYLTDHTMACGTLMYDITTQSWSSDILDRFGIEPERLPEIRWAGEAAGRLRKQAAEELGLRKDVLVCVGAQDQKIAALGANLGPGRATLSLGTAGTVEVLAGAPVFDAKMRIPCCTYMHEGQWVLESVLSTAGAALKWYRNALFPKLSYTQLDSLCGESPIGSHGAMFYPHLAGASSPYWDERARGSFLGISLSTKTSDLSRSVLEGIAFQIRTNLAVTESLGAEAQELHVFGGGGASRFWCGVIADVSGRRVTAFGSTEIANLGAGILAARGCGVYSQNFGRKILENCTVFEPHGMNTAIYDELYQKYLDIEKRIVNGI